MNHFISIQAAAGEYGISTRWIWKSIRVDRTLGAVVRNGRVYLRRIQWEAFVERHPRFTCAPAIPLYRAVKKSEKFGEPSLIALTFASKAMCNEIRLEVAN